MPKSHTLRTAAFTGPLAILIYSLRSHLDLIIIMEILLENRKNCLFFLIIGVLYYFYNNENFGSKLVVSIFIYFIFPCIKTSDST